MYCAVKCLTGSNWLQQLTFVLDGSVHAKGNLPLFLGWIGKLRDSAWKLLAVARPRSVTAVVVWFLKGWRKELSVKWSVYVGDTTA